MQQDFFPIKFSLPAENPCQQEQTWPKQYIQQRMRLTFRIYCEALHEHQRQSVAMYYTSGCILRATEQIYDATNPTGAPEWNMLSMF